MSRTTVVLVLQTSLDVAAARRLADYGTLDDAGVARALEQVHMQRWGRGDPPGHLRCIDRLAAVISVDGRISCLNGSEQGGEKARLTALFDAWPSGSVDIVDWDGSALTWLYARAIANNLRWPEALADATPRPLAAWTAPTPAEHPAPAEQIEQELLRLIGGLASPAAFDCLSARATARYRVWLRWCYSAGRLNERERQVHAARLDQLVGQA